jgi:hypothetical protein
MSWIRVRLHRLTWSAWLAVWALWLVPTLAHARMLPQRGAAALAEICTPRGAAPASPSLPGADEQSPAAAWHGPGNAACCVSIGGVPGMQLSGVALALGRVAGAEAPAELCCAPRWLAVRVAAQPRAPPSVR